MQNLLKGCLLSLACIAPLCAADARQFSTQRILNESKSDCCWGEAGRPVQLNTARLACIKLTRPVSSSGAPGAHTFTHYAKTLSTHTTRKLRAWWMNCRWVISLRNASSVAENNDPADNTHPYEMTEITNFCSNETFRGVSQSGTGIAMCLWQ